MSRRSKFKTRSTNVLPAIRRPVVKQNPSHIHSIITTLVHTCFSIEDVARLIHRLGSRLDSRELKDIEYNSVLLGPDALPSNFSSAGGSIVHLKVVLNEDDEEDTED